jgi:hypothetical protein
LNDHKGYLKRAQSPHSLAFAAVDIARNRLDDFSLGALSILQPLFFDPRALVQR